MVSPLWQDMQGTMNKEMRKSFVASSEVLPYPSLHFVQFRLWVVKHASIHREKELHGQ
jgi:hypothetical protein